MIHVAVHLVQQIFNHVQIGIMIFNDCGLSPFSAPYTSFFCCFFSLNYCGLIKGGKLWGKNKLK
jgi:hypothetical protein